jgi:hypothetical protein
LLSTVPRLREKRERGEEEERNMWRRGGEREEIRMS